MNARRPERVGDQIRRVLARTIPELADPRVGFVTVTEVRMSADLRYAHVYYTVMDAGRRASCAAGLIHALPFIRRVVAREAGLRHTPELRFEYDEALESGQRVEQLLDDLAPPVSEDRDDEL